MLYDILTSQPQVIGTILTRTPHWVWGLLAALLGLGLSQARDRIVSIKRMALMPVAMTGLSLWGLASAFGGSPRFGYVMLMWMFTFAVIFTATALASPPQGTEYDATSRRFSLRGSWLPLVLIVGIFLTRYWVNVELAMAPMLAHDRQYTLVVGALYGVFSGLFAGRAACLLTLALPPGTVGLTLQRSAR